MPDTTPHEPTDEQRRTVRAMSAYGIKQAEIAACIGISDRTLRKHYAHEIATAATEANAKVAESLFKKATGDGKSAVTAAIFWLKTRAGWKETTVNEISGPNGGPIQTDDNGAKAALAHLIARHTAGGGSDGDTGEPDGGAG